MSVNSTRSKTKFEIFGRSGSVTARANDTHMLFAVLTTLLMMQDY